MPQRKSSRCSTSEAERDVATMFEHAPYPEIITANLKRSGLFMPIDQAAFIEKLRALTQFRTMRIGAPSTLKRS
jgi:hypothetical protein